MIGPDFNGRSDEFLCQAFAEPGKGGIASVVRVDGSRAVGVGQGCSRSADSFYGAGLVGVDRFADGRKEVFLS